MEFFFAGLSSNVFFSMYFVHLIPWKVKQFELGFFLHVARGGISLNFGTFCTWCIDGLVDIIFHLGIWDSRSDWSLERNHIFPNRAKHKFLFFRMVAGSGCYLNSCVFLIIHPVHVIHGAKVGVNDHFQISLLSVNSGTCKFFTHSPSVSLAANLMESTGCLLGVLRDEKVRQWFEHDSSFQMVARLSLVSRPEAGARKVDDFCCCFQTCENDEPHLRRVEVS